MLDRIKRMLTGSQAIEFPKFAVPMPEAGPLAHLLFDMNALEEIERQLGDDYLNIIHAGFTSPSPLIISRCLALTFRDGPVEDAPWGLSPLDLGRRLYDGLLRSTKGITLADAEEIIKGEREKDKRSEEVTE